MHPSMGTVRSTVRVREAPVQDLSGGRRVLRQRRILGRATYTHRATLCCPSSRLWQPCGAAAPPWAGRPRGSDRRRCACAHAAPPVISAVATRPDYPRHFVRATGGPRASIPVVHSGSPTARNRTARGAWRRRPVPAGAHPRGSAPAPASGVLRLRAAQPPPASASNATTSVACKARQAANAGAASAWSSANIASSWLVGAASPEPTSAPKAARVLLSRTG